MMANSAVPGDSAVAPVSTGPSTKRSRVSRKTTGPAAIKAKPTLGAVTAATRARAVAKPPTKAKAKVKAKAKAPSAAEEPTRRTSEILRQILEENPQDMISVEQILKGLGTTSFGTSILVFSIPEVIPIPVPGLSAVVALPEALLGAQMLVGSREVRLPKALLKRSIPRKAFEKAVKALLPFLERAEKNVRPRWQWATSPAAKRFLGAFIVVLACVIALPIPMTNMPPAIAIFLMALGLVERDGKFIAAGVGLGLASIALIGGAFFGLFSLFGGTV
jgi:hypothetical protein